MNSYIPFLQLRQIKMIHPRVRIHRQRIFHASVDMLPIHNQADCIPAVRRQPAAIFAGQCSIIRNHLFIRQALPMITPHMCSRLILRQRLIKKTGRNRRKNRTPQYLIKSAGLDLRVFQWIAPTFLDSREILIYRKSLNLNRKRLHVMPHRLQAWQSSAFHRSGAYYASLMFSGSTARRTKSTISRMVSSLSASSSEPKNSFFRSEK